MEHDFIRELLLHHYLSHHLFGWPDIIIIFSVITDVCDLYITLQIMSDKNMEDNDIVPAPKLIEVVFQNCRGQVDHWLEPYLRITVERLRHTEKAYLKCLFMQVVRRGCYKINICMNE